LENAYKNEDRVIRINPIQYRRTHDEKGRIRVFDLLEEGF